MVVGLRIRGRMRMVGAGRRVQLPKRDARRYLRYSNIGNVTSRRLDAVFLLSVLFCLAPQTIFGQEGAATQRRTLSEVQGTPVPAGEPQEPAILSAAVRERVDAAVELLADGNIVEALNRAESALNLPDGECYDVLRLIAECKARMGRTGEARVVAERAAAMRHGAADLHFLLGLLYEEQARRAQSAAADATASGRRDENWDRAIAHYRTATLAADRELNNARVTAAWYRLAECLNQVGDWPAAVEAYARFDETVFEDAVEHRGAPEVASILVENPLGALEKRVLLYEQLERMEEAAKVTRAAVEQWPDDAFVRRLHVRVLLRANLAKEAFSFVRDLLERMNPGDHAASGRPDGPLLLAIEAAQASGELERWVTEVSNDAADGIQIPLALEIARRLSAVGAHRDAIRVYRAIGRVRPDDPDVAWGLASSLRDNGGLREAIAALIEFVRRAAGSPAAVDALLGGARLNEWMVSFDATREALEMIEAAAKDPAADFAAYFVLGITAAAAEQHELADRLLAAGIAQRPDYVPLRLAASRAALARFDWESAKRFATEALQIDANSVSALYLKAEAHAGLDEIDAADTAFRQALQNASVLAGEPGADGGAAALASTIALSYARFQSQLADRPDHARDWQVKAQRYYQQAITLDARNAAAVEGLVDSYISAEKLEIARTQLARAEQGDLPEDVLRRLRTALRFTATRGSNEHIAELERQWRDHPTDHLTGLRLVMLLFARERYEEAENIMAAVRALRPQEDSVLGWSAQLAARRLRFADAARQIEILRTRYPNRPSVLLPLVETYLAEFRIEEARAELRRMLTLAWDESLQKRVRGLLIGSMDILGEYDEALELLEHWQSEFPGDETYRNRWYELMILAGRTSEAMEAATKYLEEAANDPMRQQWFVNVCIRAKAFRAAEERIRAWTSVDRPNFAVTEIILDLLIRDGRADEAYELAKGLRPESMDQDVQRREWLGKCDLAAGRLDDGVAEYDALLESTQGRRDPALRLRVQMEVCEALSKAGRYDEALARIDKELNALPMSEVSARLAYQQQKLAVLHASGKAEDYLRLLEQLHEAFPGRAILNNNLGYSLVDENRDIERGLRLIQRAVADEPLSAVYLDSLGWAYYKKGDFAAAHKYLSRAVRLREGRDGVIFDHLGDAAYRLGDTAAAREAWQKSLEIADSPESVTSEAERAKLHATIRAKLAALDRGQPVPVARIPTETP